MQSSAFADAELDYLRGEDPLAGSPPWAKTARGGRYRRHVKLEAAEREAARGWDFASPPALPDEETLD